MLGALNQVVKDVAAGRGDGEDDVVAIDAEGLTLLARVLPAGVGRGSGVVGSVGGLGWFGGVPG